MSTTPVNKKLLRRGPEHDPVIKNCSRIKGERRFIYLINSKKLHRVSRCIFEAVFVDGVLPGTPIEQFLSMGSCSGPLEDRKVHVRVRSGAIYAYLLEPFFAEVRCTDLKDDERITIRRK